VASGPAELREIAFPRDQHTEPVQAQEFAVHGRTGRRRPPEADVEATVDQVLAREPTCPVRLNLRYDAAPR
jgi:hypothetical protein